MGCKELIDEKKPAVPRPWTVEFNDGCIVLRNPKVPRPTRVEFRVGCTVLRNPRVPRP